VFTLVGEGFVAIPFKRPYSDLISQWKIALGGLTNPPVTTGFVNPVGANRNKL
jgi:hypothetical protein